VSDLDDCHKSAGTDGKALQVGKDKSLKSYWLDGDDYNQDLESPVEEERECVLGVGNCLDFDFHVGEYNV
jgi:hypothetical protein